MVMAIGLLVDHVVLARRDAHIPVAGEASRRDEGIAGAPGALGAVVAGDDDLAGQQVAELVLGKDDAPFADGAFPDAGVETGVGRAVEIPCALEWVAGNDAVGGWTPCMSMVGWNWGMAEVDMSGSLAGAAGRGSSNTPWDIVGRRVDTCRE
jgi:hypothetical protein